MNSIRRNPFQAESMLRATSAYKSAHHCWRGLEGFQICLCFCIKWMISGLSIPLPLLHCYCFFFCIFPSYCLFVPGRILEPLPSCMGGFRCALCSVLCLQHHLCLVHGWEVEAGSSLLHWPMQFILYSSLRYNFPFNRAPFPWGCSLIFLLYVWWQIFVSFAPCLGSCAWQKGKQRGQNTLLQFFFLFIFFFNSSVVVERNLLQVPDIIWGTGPNEKPVLVPGRAWLRDVEAWWAPWPCTPGAGPASLSAWPPGSNSCTFQGFL